jgi:hypothetical protein
MKKVLLATVLGQVLTLGTASASGWMVNCSSANGGIMFKDGHVERELSVQKYISGVETEKVDFIDALRSGEIQLNKQHIKNIEVIDNNDKACRNPGDFVWGSVEETSVEKITITKTDGSEFEGSYSGLSRDKKAISDYVICNTFRSWQYKCPEKND